ncbi:hypothetical protein [Turicibacter sanguinis]|uniref:hypothetical protein n=1 Tax=Turicibacter sanguinis TaxID=154288 RepID=UPI00241FB82C|nr:hypothetical protein [Turicibacter sanguinis]
MNKYLAYECTECGVISLYRKNRDEIGCIKCSGFILPIGEAICEASVKEERPLILQAHCNMSKEVRDAEENRIKTLTGLRTCIIPVALSVSGDNNG